MIKGEEYVERLKEYKRTIYVAGKKIENWVEHPNVKPVINAIATTYEIGQNYAVYSNLVGENVNVLNAVIKSAEDLIKRYDYQRELSLRLATCNYRCTGCDAINALYPVTKMIDERNGTDYHKRFVNLLKEIQKKDLACTSALTDVKGDRSKRPLEQEDMFVRVVKKDENGIYVSGAKIHQSGAFAADVNFVLPTQTFKEKEERFAIAFASLPGDDVKFVLQNTGVQAKFREGGKFEMGNPKFGDRTTCMVIFKETFIPWERVFVFEDLKATRDLLTLFACSHRCVGAACKAGFIDSIAGVASMLLKVNGLENVSALRQKVAEIVAFSEAAHAIAVGGAVKGYSIADSWQPCREIANSAKVVGVEAFIKSIANLIDIAGGIPATAPSEFDLSSEIGEIVKNFMKGSERFSAEDRMKVIKLAEFWIMSSHLVGAFHGGGSPSAALVFLQFLADLAKREKAVCDLLDIKS
ncbi:MAG: 4-hydroxyphenylacetate 3-hydroxylase N-terminal domain-containing protein [Archaeoglobaceae archaeon]